MVRRKRKLKRKVRRRKKNNLLPFRDILTVLASKIELGLSNETARVYVYPDVGYLLIGKNVFTHPVPEKMDDV
jgi:hypothetical protein